jgi:hypothetical protein
MSKLIPKVSCPFMKINLNLQDCQQIDASFQDFQEKIPSIMVFL